MEINAFSLELFNILSGSNIVIGSVNAQQDEDLLNLCDEIVALHEKYNGDTFRFG